MTQIDLTQPLGNPQPFEFEMDAEDMQSLLSELDRRLQARGVAASIYLIGGAAMALAYGRASLTPDIDGIASHVAVIEEAEHIASVRGLPPTWLNENARMFVPPRPDWALAEPCEPGLTVYVAPPRHILAMKLVALRAKDRPDIRLLVDECGMRDALPQDYADLLREVFPGEGQLAQVLGVPGGDEMAAQTEARLIGELALRVVRPS